jgi:ribosomal protein S12 methylthiotransferase
MPILQSSKPCRAFQYEWVSETIAKMRSLIPNLVVRTTMIVGYPNESDKSFKTLRNFIRNSI